MDEQKIDASPTTRSLGATVTHKLKSPLTTINLYSEALLSGSVGTLTPEQSEYVQEISKASKKMVVYVNDLATVLGNVHIPEKS
ncbi:MAG: histidine kinase dimerization/phospho-acceptor domain-containing protein [Patescibacteria group bacterium]|nr:histidine kinase dimerization/phospho-acceptor domain-containing protein [Patescibacteria group bacterium]